MEFWCRSLTVIVSTVRVFDEMVCDDIMSDGETFSSPGIDRSSSSVISPLSFAN